jgi:RNA polymerase sigma-70 factor (ECF subfamily)
LRESDPCFTDDEFIRARAGEHAAFAALVRAHQRMVYGIALRMLADRAEALDLGQEVFLQLHRNLQSIESNEHLLFWLRRVTAHRAIDSLRVRRRLAWAPLEAAREVPVAGADPDPLLHGRLERLVQQLAPMPRAVIVLRYQQDLDPVEIARTLEIPVNTVKSHLQRSLERLRRQLSAGSSDVKAVGREQ